MDALKSLDDPFFLETQAACDRPPTKAPHPHIQHVHVEMQGEAKDPNSQADRVDVVIKRVFGRWCCWIVHGKKVQTSIGDSTLVESQLDELLSCSVVCPVVECFRPKPPLHGDGCPCGDPRWPWPIFRESIVCKGISVFSEQGFWDVQYGGVAQRCDDESGEVQKRQVWQKLGCGLRLWPGMAHGAWFRGYSTDGRPKI